MPRLGLDKLRSSQKFVVTGKNNVLVQFGKYKDLTFKDISMTNPEYLDYLIDAWNGQMTSEVQRRLQYWRRQSNRFFI